MQLGFFLFGFSGFPVLLVSLYHVFLCFSCKSVDFWLYFGTILVSMGACGRLLGARRAQGGLKVDLGMIFESFWEPAGTLFGTFGALGDPFGMFFYSLFAGTLFG